MAYFTVSDEIRTLKYLGYSPNDVVFLRNQQTIAYRNFGDAIVTEVQLILSKLDEADDTEASYATDPSSNLIKADVLEWDASGRQGNLAKRSTTLKKQLSSIFAMPVKNNYSGTRVYKG